mgnify:CR=1 FL=1
MKITICSFLMVAMFFSSMAFAGYSIDHNTRLTCQSLDGKYQLRVFPAPNPISVGEYFVSAVTYNQLDEGKRFYLDRLWKEDTTTNQTIDIQKICDATSKCEIGDSEYKGTLTLILGADKVSALVGSVESRMECTRE